MKNYKDQFMEYNSQVTQNVNDNVLPDGYSITETQMLYVLGGVLTAFVLLTIYSCKKPKQPNDDDYMRSDLLKNENGVSA